MYKLLVILFIIFQVDISQQVDWSATCPHTHSSTVDQRKWYFLWYPFSFFFTLYRSLHFSAMDSDRESKVYLLPFPCHQGLSWATGWMNHIPYSTSKIRSLHCLFFSRSFILYALVSSWLPYRWAIGLNTHISKSASSPEIQNPLATISTRIEKYDSYYKVRRNIPRFEWQILGTFPVMYQKRWW